MHSVLSDVSTPSLCKAKALSDKYSFRTSARRRLKKTDLSLLKIQ